MTISYLLVDVNYYGAKYDGDTDVGKITINGTEHDIRNAVKGFDKKLVSDIAKHLFDNLFDNMKLSNINPKLAVVGIDDMIGLALIFLLISLGIIIIPAIGITEPYTGTLPSLEDIKANANSSASKILNFLL